MEDEKIAYCQVKFFYKDGKDMNVNMIHDKLESFFESLNNKKIFWYGDEENPDLGFWTNIEDIRFIQIHTVKGTPHEEGKEEEESPVEICTDEK